jgi:hypothetical protein
MCDYSNEQLKNRPAVVGEKLSAHRFSTGSVGMIGQNPTKGEVAVCLIPGMKGTIAGIPRQIRHEYHLDRTEPAVFAKRDFEGTLFKDCLVFEKNGEAVLLQYLEGVTMEVELVVMPTDDMNPPAVAAQSRAHRDHSQLAHVYR